MAIWYYRQGSLEGLRRAVRWNPRNPRFVAALARGLTLEGADPAEVVRLYEHAARLEPAQADYWAQLGGAYEWAGREEEARRAYERARELFPNSPDINWQLGNFYVRAGRTRDALHALAKTVRSDPGMGPAAFDVAWRAGIPAEQILAEMLPSDQAILLSYLSYLLGTQRLDEAGRVWARVLASKAAFEPQAAFRYLDALIAHRRIEELTAAWAALAERNPTLIPSRRREHNLMTDGGFEDAVLNGGLGWRVAPLEGAAVEVDNLTFFDGAHSFAVHFDGKHNLDYGHVYQYVPVRPDTAYRFTGYMRTRGITTDSGPRFLILDAYSRAKLSAATQDLRGTAGWTPVQLDFRTGPDTRLLLVQLARLPSWKFDNQIAGTVWIDHLTLSLVE